VELAEDSGSFIGRHVGRQNAIERNRQFFPNEWQVHRDFADLNLAEITQNTHNLHTTLTKRQGGRYYLSEFWPMHVMRLPNSSRFQETKEWSTCT